MSSNPLVKIGLGILGIVTLGVGALYWSNKQVQKETVPLTKQQLIHLLKVIRKHKYSLYKQIATFSLNISRQMRGNINSQMIQQFLEGPESPLKIQQEFQRIKQSVCNSQNTTIEALDAALHQFQADGYVAQLNKQQEQDLKTSLLGRLPIFQLQIPATFTQQNFLNTHNQITKKTYLQQVAIFRKLTQHSQEEIQRNPAILNQFSNHDNELEQILMAANLGTQYDPPFAVFESANLKYRSNPQIRAQIAKVEEGYQKIMQTYTIKIQNKTIRQNELTDLEDEIIYFGPLI